jgi:hypothetical protein
MEIKKNIIKATWNEGLLGKVSTFLTAVQGFLEYTNKIGICRALLITKKF